jgi:hypothetical protein
MGSSLKRWQLLKWSRNSQILWNTKVHQHIHRCLSLHHLLGQLNPPILSHHISPRFIWTLSSHLRLDLPSGHTPWSSVTEVFATSFLWGFCLHICLCFEFCWGYWYCVLVRTTTPLLRRTTEKPVSIAGNLAEVWTGNLLNEVLKSVTTT